MYANPVTYIAGLLDERAGAVQLGRDAVVSEIDAELAAARKELEKIDLADLEKDAKDALAGVRRRLAAHDSSVAPKPDAESEAAEEPAGAAQSPAATGKRTAKAPPPPRTA